MFPQNPDSHFSESTSFKDSYQLVTVWSAPNYCYRCGNVASILAFDNNLNRREIIFQATEENETMMPPRNNIRYFL